MTLPTAHTLASLPDPIRTAIRAVSRKRKAFIRIAESVTCHGTYWDGGSRSVYHRATLGGRVVPIPCPMNPPNFGGGEAPTVPVTPGVGILRSGTFCGKASTPTLYLHPTDAAKLLEDYPS